MCMPWLEEKGLASKGKVRKKERKVESKEIMQMEDNASLLTSVHSRLV